MGEEVERGTWTHSGGGRGEGYMDPRWVREGRGVHVAKDLETFSCTVHSKALDRSFARELLRYQI